MPKVYVSQETSHDFREAETFGELVFLTDRRDDFHNVKNSQHNERLIAHMRQGLREYQPHIDYVVLVGSPYIAAALMHLIGGSSNRTVKLLRWDNRDLHYIPLELSFG